MEEKKGQKILKNIQQVSENVSYGSFKVDITVSKGKPAKMTITEINKVVLL